MSVALGNRLSKAIVVVWAVELALLVLAVMGAAQIRFLGEPADHLYFLQDAPVRGLVAAVAITLSMAAFGLYQPYQRHSPRDFLLRLIISFLCGAVALLVLYYIIPMIYIGRGVLSIALAAGFAAIASLRLALRYFFRTDVFRRRVLVWGAGRHAEMVLSRFRNRTSQQAFSLLGFVAIPGQASSVPSSKVIERDGTLLEIADRLGAHEILVAPDERRGGIPMEEMLMCVQSGVNVTDLSTFFEREAGLVSFNIVDPSWLVFSGGFDHSLPRRLSKRAFDLVTAATLLAIAWPVMLLVALAVRLESEGPMLYRQVRVGQNGRSFEVLKFRSMRTDAEKDGKARWATKNDDRVTRVGRFIRKTRLDELPQLINVLRGQMSFVGPRPERPQFVDQLNQEIRYYNVRHSVKPGLTGWAQLRYPYGASVEDAQEKLNYDLFYVKNHGLVFDFMIMLQTVEVVLFGRGAR